MSMLPFLGQDRAIASDPAATRTPPTVLAYLCSSFLGSVECVTILQCCRAWCLRGADRQLMQRMIAEASSHASAHSDGSEEQTVDGEFYRAPRGQSPSADLPWRQRHMDRVQHVLVQLQTQGISEPRILPSFATLPSPSTAPPAFTLVDRPFELRWSTRRMRPELVVLVRIPVLYPDIIPFLSTAHPTDREQKLQSELWTMLDEAFRASSLPLSVTIVDERVPMQAKRKGSKQPQTVSGVRVSPNEVVDCPASTLALSTRWMPDAVAPASSDGSASSSSGVRASPSSTTGIPLRIHSLVFHTYRHDFSRAVLQALGTFTAPLKNTPFQAPALPEQHRQWATSQLGWNSATTAQMRAADLLTPLCVVCYRSTDPTHPKGLPMVLRRLLARPMAEHLPDHTVEHMLHTVYIDVAHEVDLDQILRPLAPRHPQPREIYLIGVQPKRVALQSFEDVRTVVIRPPMKRHAEAAPLDFNAMFTLLAQRMASVERIELVDSRFGSPSLLRVWCPRATSIRLERCGFDDDDGLIDLEAHAKSLWPLPPPWPAVPGLPDQHQRSVPRFRLTPGCCPTALDILLDAYCTPAIMAWMMLPCVLMCLAPTVAVDAILSYLPLSAITRVVNLGCFFMLYAGLAFVFFSLLVSEWNSFDAITDAFHSPPSAQIYVRNGMGLFGSWMLWASLLVSLPWHRGASVDPLSAVVCVSVCKMMLNSLSSANTASWVRVQRAKANWRAFVRYFARLAIIRSVQLRWFLSTYAGAIWLSSTGIIRRASRQQPCTSLVAHSLAQRLFVNSITCGAPIEYVVPPRVAPLLWTECRALVRSVNLSGWLRSWLDGAAWTQWSREWLAHLHSVLHAMPHIFAVAIVLFALQQLVRIIRRNLAPNVPLLITEPLRMASVLLKW